MSEESRIPAEGGCLCGAIRYRVLAEPSWVGNCHCTLCRRASGAPFVSWLTVASDAFALTKGRPVGFNSSPFARRQFCGTCGTQLTFQRNKEQDSIDVTVATLDNPDAFPPHNHVFVGTHLSWLSLEDGLPQKPGTPPG